MRPSPEDTPIRVFSTCPQSSDFAGDDYKDAVAQVARWSEAAGCDGVLIYTDNSLIDPWSVAHIVADATTTLSPLLAIQPVYMHPYFVAKMIASFAYLHRRRVHLNLLAGGFKNDLTALGDRTAHDRRYDRLVEYAGVIRGLTGGADPVSLNGEFYSVENLRLAPAVPEALRPGLLLSGSSEAGRAAAAALDAVAIAYPEAPVAGARPEPVAQPSGVRIGVIARASAEEAWRVAHERFPTDRRGQVTHHLAMKVSDSAWHRQLSKPAEHDVYWLGPFQNYKTFCPYLVGSYDQVAEFVAQYFEAGHRDVILDIPRSADDLAHTAIALDAAKRKAFDHAPA